MTEKPAHSHAHDRREDHRVPVSLPVRIHRKNGDDIQGTSVNWSRSGVFVNTPAQFDTGERVQLSVRIPGENRFISFPGVVIRQIPEIMADFRHPAGAAFFTGVQPREVSALIGELARNLIHSPEHPAGEPFDGTVMLVEGGKTARAKHGMYLETCGAEVAEADTLEQAEALIQRGLRPKAVVIFTPFVRDRILGFIDRTRLITGSQLMRFVVVSELAQGTPEAIHHHALLVHAGPIEPRKLLALIVVLLGHEPGPDAGPGAVRPLKT